MIDVADYIDGCPEIGYVLGKDYWNNGYMTVAFAAVVKYLFEEEFKCIHIRADEHNIGSNKVIRKNGFEFVEKKIEPCSQFKSELVAVNYYVRYH